MYICLDRKIGLIRKKASYRSICSVFYCKPIIIRWHQASPLCISVLFFYLKCLQVWWACSDKAFPLSGSCAEDISAAAWSFVPPCVTPSFPSPLLLCTGWISTLAPPVSLCNGITTNLLWWAGPCITDRELFPPMTEPGAGWAGNEFETAEMAQVKESLTTKKKKFCSTDI